MADNATSSNDSIPNKIKIYSASEPDESSAPKDNIRKGIALLLTRKKMEEILFIHSGEGLRIMHFRYDNITHKVWMMFKRTPEIRPYYPAIKSWCEDNNLSWKDKTHNGEKYISIAMTPYLDEITKTIYSANEAIFKIKKLKAGSSSTNLSYALSDINHPIFFTFFVLGLVVSVCLLPFYQIFRLPYLGKPSIAALDWPELFLILMICAGIFTLRFLRKRQKNTRSKSRTKIYIFRGLLLFIICLAFFTY